MCGDLKLRHYTKGNCLRGIKPHKSSRYKERLSSFFSPRIPEFVSGWLSVFFPYDKQNFKRDLRWDAPKHDSEVSKDQSGEYGLRIYNKDFPSGVSSAPVMVILPNGKPLHVKLLGGFVGVEQDPVTLTLKPAISWGAAECMPPGALQGRVPP